MLLNRSMTKIHNHTHESWFSVKEGKFHIMKQDIKLIYRKPIIIFLSSFMKQEIPSQCVRDTMIIVSAW
jgi:hypothetical protein